MKIKLVILLLSSLVGGLLAIFYVTQGQNVLAQTPRCPERCTYQDSSATTVKTYCDNKRSRAGLPVCSKYKTPLVCYTGKAPGDVDGKCTNWQPYLENESGVCRDPHCGPCECDYELEVVMTPNCIDSEGCTEYQKMTGVTCQLKNNDQIPSNSAIHFAVWTGAGSKDKAKQLGNSYYKGSQTGPVTINLVDQIAYSKSDPKYQWAIKDVVGGNTVYRVVVPFYYECNLTENKGDPKIQHAVIEGLVNYKPSFPSYTSSTVTGNNCNLSGSGNLLRGTCPAGSLVEVKCLAVSPYNDVMHQAFWLGSADEQEAKSGKYTTPPAFQYRGFKPPPAVRTGVPVPFYYECVAQKADGKIGTVFKGSVGVAACNETGDLNKDGRVNLTDFDNWEADFLTGTMLNKTDCDLNSRVDLIDFNIWRHYYQGGS